MLKAYIDESAQDALPGLPRLLVYAGYVSTPARWKDFSSEWLDCLNQEPKLRFFKMRDAMGLSGEFGRRKFNEENRNERVAKFHKIIGNHVAGTVWLVLHLDAFDEVFRSNTTVPPRMKNKHFYMTFGLMHHLARFSHLLGFDVPIEFIFDTQTRGRREISAAWESFRTGSPVPVHRLVGEPTFADDTVALPLQAADMRAWVIRKKSILQIKKAPSDMPWESANKDAHSGYKSIGEFIGREKLLAHIQRATANNEKLKRGEYFPKATSDWQPSDALDKQAREPQDDGS